MKKVARKAVAYITHEANLLVFRHPHHAQAGIQVPAGVIEAGETPDEAVMREAFEETQLDHLQLHGFLGTVNCDMTSYGRDEVQRRFFSTCSTLQELLTHGSIMSDFPPMAK
jgi:8-oxo-dGTP pyrophosphatase MutT (NUDIX family)